MRTAPSRLFICLSIIVSVEFVLIAMAGANAAAAAAGLSERYGYGFGYVMNQRRIEARRKALALRRAHHDRSAAAIRMAPQREADDEITARC